MHFSDFFGVTQDDLDAHGAFNISLTTDLPLFIDPFLLFASEEPQYQELHAAIIRYLRYLRDRTRNALPDAGLIRAWFHFPEVRQNWFGFSTSDNRGRGLGAGFASSMSQSMHLLFGEGAPPVTQEYHLEKLCLLRAGVGRDFISDFTTNLIKGWLAAYTEQFARQYISRALCFDVSVDKCSFDYRTGSWQPRLCYLPQFGDDYVLLTPCSILTKDDTWINHSDLVRRLHSIAIAVPNEQLRSQLNSYLGSRLTAKSTARDRHDVAAQAIRTFPDVIDYYIGLQEKRTAEARAGSIEKVARTHEAFVQNARHLASDLNQVGFYDDGDSSYEACLRRVHFLKDVVENKGGHRLFYVKGKPLQRELDLHIVYRLTWHGTKFDVTREANDGRGPVDYKVSLGARDKTLVEFKLASNSKLRRNLLKQTPVYQAASDAHRSIKVVFFFTDNEHASLVKLLGEPAYAGIRDVLLIDARADNKPSGSMA